MQVITWFLILLIPLRDSQSIRKPVYNGQPAPPRQLRELVYPPDSWEFFLQHLPTEDKPIVDFNGNLVSNQGKHVAILPFDVGHTDLQQCADALIRIRAEYLFRKKLYPSIGFHFISGSFYSYSNYLKGMRPVLKGRGMIFKLAATTSVITHGSLRKYLDIVYAYANTVSLCNELKYTNRLETGTIIIFPGNPGHCCMIFDAAVSEKSDTVFKILEGYMPAQSIYVLSNPYEPDWNPWYHLGKGEISTSSCIFKSYYLRKFE